MRHGLVAALSPTPRNGSMRSLVPSSPSRMSFHRNRLERASSSVGHVTAAGLTTWRRGPKRYSSDAESGKKGLGMGMEGTPGRRKKARSTSKSLGVQSTPKRSSSSRHPTNAHSTSSSSIPISDLPDLDDLTQGTNTMVDFLEISSPAAQAIPDLDRIEVGSQIDPTLKNAMAHSSPTEDQVEALEPLFNEQDMLVPLNDLSQLDRIMADTPDHVVTDVAAHSDSESGEDPTPMAVDRITREDFTVPLNDIYASNDTVMTADTVALEDLTVPLNDITHFYQTPVAGRAATVHTRRQSTPFVRRMRGQPLPAQENTFGHEDEDEVEYGRAAPQDVAASSNDIPSSWLETRVPHDRTQQLKPPSPLAYSPLLGFQMDNIRTPQRVTLDSPLDARVAVEADEYSTPVELIAASDLPDVFDQKYLPARCHEEAEWDDRFGFAAVQQFIQGRHARPYLPSSQLGKSTPSPASSTMCFSSTPSMLTVESSECEDHSSPRSFTRQTDGTKRSQKGMWRGAEVLARMDAGLDDARTAQEHDQPQNEDTEGRGAEEGERASDHDMAAPVTDRPRQYHPTRRPGRMTVLSKKHQSTTVESELARVARRARITHYRDLERNYKLHVESVLW